MSEQLPDWVYAPSDPAAAKEAFIADAEAHGVPRDAAEYTLVRMRQQWATQASAAIDRRADIIAAADALADAVEGLMHVWDAGAPGRMVAALDAYRKARGEV